MKQIMVMVTLFLAIFTVACAANNPETTEQAASAIVADAVEPVTGDMMAVKPEAHGNDTTTGAMDDSMAPIAGDETMPDEMPVGDVEEVPAVTDGSMALAVWQTLPLTNARTGETFTLGDFAGRTVFVEPMATWCSNCRQQLMSVQQARAGLNDDEVVFIALSVETNISDADLARYADGFGYDWTFAVMSPEILQELATTFGRTVANPPSTPHFVIRPDGSVSDLITGIQTPADIAALVGG
jgi:thiol-disulfide isomerase/thioredoxin